MQRILAQSSQAITANNLIQLLQSLFVDQLEHVCSQLNNEQHFELNEWFRDQGQHGGGVRYISSDNALFNRASINYSQVHYDDDKTKSLGSATALSTIIHPQNPHAPSLHMHISWTELKQGEGYWRMMADLNPSIIHRTDNERFQHCLQQAAPEQFEVAFEQGDRYFYIPTLDRHRGVQHFYLEAYNSDDPQIDLVLADSIGKAVIECYCDLLLQAFIQYPTPDQSAYDQQLAYHTLYLFQVLTLDRGTTSGILVHNQNDVGILGSLPAYIDYDLLASWQALMPKPQNLLLEKILQVLPKSSPCLISKSVKQALAESIRQYYRQYPEAIKLQASGDIIPATVANHQKMSV